MPKVQKHRFLLGLKGTVHVILALAGICFGQYEWELKNPLPTDNDFTSITYINNQFVAVGDTGALLTSSDGEDWAAKNSGTLNKLNATVYGNGLYVAVGNSGTIVTSPDGTTWTEKYSGTSNNLNSVSFGANQFVAVGNEGTILTSHDGDTWVAQNSGTTVNLNSLAFGNNQFVAVGEKIISVRNGGSHAMILASSDGVAWSIKNHFNDRYYFVYYNSVIFQNDRFVIAGRGTTNDMCKGACYSAAFIETSTDGSTWTVPYSGPKNSNLMSLAYGNGQFVAVGWAQKQSIYGYSPAQALLLTSPDGATWSEIDPETANGFPAVLVSATYGNNQYVALGKMELYRYYEYGNRANIVVSSRVVADKSCKATNIGDGTVAFEVTFAAPQQYVEVFVRQNGLQNVAQNIVNNIINNGDGTITYKLTRGGYNPGDMVEYRFYSYAQNSPGVFTPGSIENRWNRLVLDK
ncbi:MAG TPA: hypothetical protein VK465_01170 [Fibrobacteria bacterium]|nr:hypothetical protein [Fibrobacteria bacterium]